MEANSTHISLETAKLLKGCGVESEKYWCYRSTNVPCGIYDVLSYEESVLIDVESKGRISCRIAPAYTWQEILWEHAVEFFGKIRHCAEGLVVRTYSNTDECVAFTTTEYIERNLLFLLQKQKYEEADEYFRKNCILIKK